MRLARHLFERIGSALEAPPPDWIARRPGYVWGVVGTTCIGAVIGQLDASIVQLAMPVLEREFDCGLSSVSWVALGYLVAFAAVLAPFARLSQITGRKRLYIAGFLLFSLASALCGMAGSLHSLVACRILQGIGGSLLGANSVTILVSAAGPDRRGRAMGLFAAAQAIGVGVGPAVGGWLVSSLGWRSVFWTTVPFGLAGALAAWLLVPPSPAAPARSRFDGWGMVLLGPGLTALLLVLSKGSSWGLQSWRTVVSLLAASLLLAGFLRRERRTTAPLIQLSLLGRRDFAWGIVGIALSYGMLYGMFFLMSFVLVRGGHLSPIEAGLHLAILPVALGLAAPFSGFLSERVGPRWLQVSGMICCAAGLLMMNGALGNLENLGRDRLVTLMALLLFGAGLGLFISPNNSATLAAAPASESAVAGGLLNLFRVLGTSVGVAAASSTLSWRLAAAAGPAVSIASLPADILFRATAQSLFLLLGFALVAAMGSLVGQPQTRRNS